MQSSTIQSPTELTVNWQTQVYELVLKARQYPAGSYQRNQCLTQIIRLVEPRLWKFYTPYYADALQQTWLYFAKNVCTVYDPTRASVATWLNNYLRYRHQDLTRQDFQHHYQEVSIDIESKGKDGSSFKAMDIPTRKYGSLSLLEEVIEWVKTDSDRNLQQTHVKNRPDVNCQTLILLRLPPETPWKEISSQFQVSIPTLSSFYRRNCMPYLRKLAQSIGA